MPDITGKKVAILATNGFEESELLEPKRMLEEAGAHTEVVAPQTGEIKGWKDGNWAQAIQVDKTLEECSAEDYDGLLIPGGTMNPDKLRLERSAVEFVRKFAESGKPIGAICHGPWLLVEAGVVQGREVTSWPSLRTDLENAGARWVDQEVAVDQGIVTSRKPDDIPAFSKKLIEEVREGVHARTSAATMR
jgi:protease I